MPKGHKYTNEHFLLQLYKWIRSKHREISFLLIKRNFWRLVMTLELPHSEQNLPKSILAQYSCDGHHGQMHIPASSHMCPGKVNGTTNQGRHKHTHPDHPPSLPTEDALEETCMPMHTHLFTLRNVQHFPWTSSDDGESPAPQKEEANFQLGCH